MKKVWGIWAVGVGLATASVKATQTITATFENFSPGQSFQPDFTDSLSGIHFWNSTHPPAGGFSINVDSEGLYFNQGNYLTSGGGVSDGLGSNFGFIADLPFSADHVQLDVVYGDGFPSAVVLRGFNSTGELVSQQAGTPGSNLFTLAIDSGQFDISTFQVSTGGGFSGYDNVSFVVIPEPTCGLLMTGCVTWLVVRRRAR